MYTLTYYDLKSCYINWSKIQTQNYIYFDKEVEELDREIEELFNNQILGEAARKFNIDMSTLNLIGGFKTMFMNIKNKINLIF